MMIIFFFYGLSFFGLGLAAILRRRQGGDYPLSRQLPWLAAFGFAAGTAGWIDMFLASGDQSELSQALRILRMVFQPVTGILLLKFGWGILKDLSPLPTWTIFIPGILIIPIAYVITYAATTFVTPSPIEIPIDIWSRYLLYLPGSILAGLGFLRQWDAQRKLGFYDVSGLMLGAGLAFLLEAFVVGLVVPAAPYGPSSYYNYDRVFHNAFSGEQSSVLRAFGLTSWLDYEQILRLTGLPIEFWRMLSTFAVTFFVVRGLDVFDAIRKRELEALQKERDLAQQTALEVQTAARKTAESWADALVSISRRIADLEDVDHILMYIAEHARKLLQSDFLGLALLEDDRSSLNLKCYSRDGKTQMVSELMPVTNPVIKKVIRDSQPFFTRKEGPRKDLRGVCFYPNKSAHALAAVHLNLDNNPVGALWIARFADKPYTRENLIWLECMADQLVITIQHGLMTAQLQSLSITEERARIAREMHDGLAQVLGYLNLQVQTLEALQEKGEEESLQKELRQMRQAIQTAHGDVRENILSLRTTLANEKGLLSAIDEYLREFGIQTGVETDVIIATDGGLNLASIAEVQLVCILQEALANVRKHAEARQVKVYISREITQDDEQIRMLIQDDGQGFIVDESSRRFGLQTMRERANSVGGALSIESTLGQGTTIICDLPCLSHDQISQRSVVLS